MQGSNLVLAVNVRLPVSKSGHLAFCDRFAKHQNIEHSFFYWFHAFDQFQLVPNGAIVVADAPCKSRYFTKLVTAISAYSKILITYVFITLWRTFCTNTAMTGHAMGRVRQSIY